MARAFLAPNIFVRHLRQEHPEFSPRATAYLTRIDRGELKVRTAETVIVETVFTLERFYRQPKAAMRDAFLPLLELPGSVLPGKRRLRKVCDVYVDYTISFADAYHAMLMEQLKLKEMVRVDREFDKLPAIQRVEP